LYLTSITLSEALITWKELMNEQAAQHNIISNVNSHNDTRVLSRITAHPSNLEAG
jgi:hypothetical protein